MFQWFFGVLLEALRVFLGFDFCPHLIIPITWNPESSRWDPPWPLNNWARVWNLVKFKFFFNYLVWSSHCEYHNQFHFFSHGSSVWFKFIYSQPFRTQSWPLKINVHNFVMLWLLKSSSKKQGEKINANLSITHAKLIKATYPKSADGSSSRKLYVNYT